MLRFNPFQPQQVFLCSDDAYCYSFDLRNTRQALDRYGGYPYPIISMDISPDGRKIALGSNGGTLQMYKIGTVSREGDVIQSTINKKINAAVE